MDFSKKFVCESEERSNYETHVAAPIFRKTVQIAGKVENANISICGLGFYDLFVNGKKVTKGHLAPYISNPDHIIYYDCYDIAPFLCDGENVIGVMLGDGFLNTKSCVWCFQHNPFRSAPKMAINVHIKDESNEYVFDAGDFRCKKGPVVFNDLHSGVFYDKRMEDLGWNAPGFCEDDTWHQPLEANPPKGKAQKCEAEPIVVTKELRPVKIFRGELEDYEPRDIVQEYMTGKKTQEGPPARTGGWIYDFGENNAGIFRLKIKGKRGQRIDIQCAEQEEDGRLNYKSWHSFPDGYVQRDIYIVGGEEEEIFEPMFTYHGYRYLYVSGITEEQATEELLTYLVMSSDLEERGGFRCSDEVANQIFAMGQRSDRSNFYYFPTDCPHREKLGWTGDASASAEHMIMTMGTENSWREWLHNIRCAQVETGAIPVIIPTGGWGYTRAAICPAWDRALFILPYMIYRYRGNTEVIHENAKAMMAYLQHISSKRNEKGLLVDGLGDFFPVDKGSTDYDVSPEFTNSVMTYDMCRMAKEMFEVIGLKEDSEYARQFEKELYNAIRKEYLETDTMTIKGCCQSAQAMGIYYDIFEEDEKEEAFKKLLHIIHSKDDKVDCGLLGMNVIFHVLSKYGESELAYQMITRKEYPSYGWYALNGFTTMPEHFNRKDKMESWNHHFFGDVLQWFMRYPAGLQVHNYKCVKVKPSFLKDLEFAGANHILPAGEVKVAWRRSGEDILLQVSCPEEVECEIELEEGYHLAGQMKNIWTVRRKK